MSLGVTCQHLAAGPQISTLVPRDVDVVEILRQLGLVDHGPDLGFRPQGMIDDQCADPLGKGFGQTGCECLP